ncbi:MAG: hypothetical protein ACE5RP_00295 [Nitrosopumilus sp.]
MDGHIDSWFGKRDKSKKRQPIVKGHGGEKKEHWKTSQYKKLPRVRKNVHMNRFRPRQKIWRQWVHNLKKQGRKRK